MAFVRIGHTSTNGYESDLDGFPHSQFVRNLYRMRREQQREGAPPMRLQYRRPRVIKIRASITLMGQRHKNPHSPFEAFRLLLKSLNPKYHLKFYCFLGVLAAFAILAFVT